VSDVRRPARPAPVRPGELDDPVVVAFPLRGMWAAENTPAQRIPSHGVDLLGQRYAFDFVRPDDRPGFHLHPAGTLRSYVIGGLTRECYGWGQPVHASFDGEVVAAVDGVPERTWLHVLRELALVTKNALTWRPTRGIASVAGNHVIVQGEPGSAMYAHLTTGSVAVQPGAVVREGELLGRVGHTGNSTLPHLHFQVADGRDPLTANGVACAFAAYEALRDGEWRRVERGIPRRRERIRSVGA
jgi:hypothetical protein